MGSAGIEFAPPIEVWESEDRGSGVGALVSSVTDVFSVVGACGGGAILAASSFGAVAAAHLRPHFEGEAKTGDRATAAPPSWKAHERSIYGMCWAREGGVLVTGGDDCVKLWKWSDAWVSDGGAGSKPELLRSLQAPRPPAAGGARGPFPETNAVVSEAKGDVVYGACGDGTCYGWDVETGKEVASLAGHKGGILSATVLGSRGVVATGSEDGTVRLWDVRANAEVDKLDVGGSFVGAVEASADGNWLAVGNGKGEVSIWHAGTRKRVSCAYVSEAVNVLRFVADTVVAGGMGGTLSYVQRGGAIKRRVASGLPCVYAVLHNTTASLRCTLAAGSSPTISGFIDPARVGFTIGLGPAPAS